MNGMTRFLSRREKRSNRPGRSKERNNAPTASSDLYGVFTTAEAVKGDKEEEKKVKSLSQRLHKVGITNLKDAQIEYALRSSLSNGDTEQAYDLLVLFEDSIVGILKEPDPEVPMLGAQNREMVTCYLDALLFAMFARLDSFEGMLFNNFEDVPRRRLTALLRLWVNLLRSGKLITTDITRHIQESLASCGWEEAKNISQQDTSEAFTFITEKLELPLLTLKMDIYHTGKEDAQDDHKFVNERLLEVALPDAGPDSGNSVTLEDCLEAYFNNKIEVKRHLLQRRSTLQLSRSSDINKDQAVHIETLEIDSGIDSPVTTTPTSISTPTFSKRPSKGYLRTDSIFSERFVQARKTSLESDQKADRKPVDDLALVTKRRARGGSMRKEVMMPAWQFFSLIPWYTDNAPKSDAQVAAHFSAKRPILGICLKRYTMLSNGTPKRIDTFVDIPLEIALPHFVSDDRMDDEGPLFGNFKLSLQSVVCHRGRSVNSGHYISLVRGDARLPHERNVTDTSLPPYQSTQWFLFDDLASQRVKSIDIHEALRAESPYLLFFRVEPINDELARGSPPGYYEASMNKFSADVSREDFNILSEKEAEYMIQGLPYSPAPAPGDTDTIPIIATIEPTSPRVENTPEARPVTETGHLNHVASDPTPRAPSLDLPIATAPHHKSVPVGRSSMSSNRTSVVFEDVSTAGSISTRGNTAPSSPTEDGRFHLQPASTRSSKAEKSKSKSRPHSQSGESRLAATVGLLTGRKSRDRLADRDDFAVEISDSGLGNGEEHSKHGSMGRSKGKRVSKKKRSRSMGPGGFLDSKDKEDRPDRECAVM
ncbi:cysteine proteinase [Pseudovirgaria hyperparasitica]|uniref:ubiquitinyl hydrolase 1 n=1 Tax=Pseudovirgaria hyperparasitica TaxID=470096 RepID=A0A6A6W0R4_9PEZI|nr:cysteine proteinase [Pseudovirgaria hyperparasitica]KAF2756133.1 cysteine proteinase [Pseudovirgaria hyperparasitica]